MELQSTPAPRNKKNILRWILRLFVWLILLIAIAGAVLATLAPVMVGSPDQPERGPRRQRSSWLFFGK